MMIKNIIACVLLLAGTAFAGGPAGIQCGGGTGVSGGGPSASCLGNSWTAESQTGDSTWDSGSIGNDNLIITVDSDYLSDTTACTQFRVEFKAHGFNDTVITAVGICQKASSGDAFDCETGTLDRITFDGGSNGITISAGTTEYSDWMTATNLPLTTDTDFLIKIYGASGFTSSASYLSNGLTYRYLASGDESQTANVSSYTSVVYHYIVKTLETQ